MDDLRSEVTVHRGDPWTGRDGIVIGGDGRTHKDCDGKTLEQLKQEGKTHEFK
jgi:hypothetical protein